MINPVHSSHPIYLRVSHSSIQNPSMLRYMVFSTQRCEVSHRDTHPLVNPIASPALPAGARSLHVHFAGNEGLAVAFTSSGPIPISRWMVVSWASKICNYEQAHLLIYSTFLYMYTYPCMYAIYIDTMYCFLFECRYDYV